MHALQSPLNSYEVCTQPAAVYPVLCCVCAHRYAIDQLTWLVTKSTGIASNAYLRQLQEKIVVCDRKGPRNIDVPPGEPTHTHCQLWRHMVVGGATLQRIGGRSRSWCTMLPGGCYDTRMWQMLWRRQLPMLGIRCITILGRRGVKPMGLFWSPVCHHTLPAPHVTCYLRGHLRGRCECARMMCILAGGDSLQCMPLIYLCSWLAGCVQMRTWSHSRTLWRMLRRARRWMHVCSQLLYHPEDGSAGPFDFWVLGFRI